MPLAEASLDLLQQFERGLEPQQPEQSAIPARVLGYGEISTVFEIQAEGLRGLAFKRLPLFYNDAEVDAYTRVYAEYNRLLEQEIGLRLPTHDYAVLRNASGRPIFYIIQQQLPADAIGNRAILRVPREQVAVLVARILRELRKVWEFNRRQARVRVGIDGQISNWVIASVIANAAKQSPSRETEIASSQSALLAMTQGDPLYVDTSTPLYRVDGVEQLDTELFLRSAPSFLVWILRLLFLKDVVERYYDFRRVAIDLAANFYKEQRPDLIPDVLQAINAFFASEAAELGIQPIAEKEVRDYYREDALIWSLYLAMRKVDRFLRTRVLRKEYPYILPEKIKR
jgi:hypothetical protein